MTSTSLLPSEIMTLAHHQISNVAQDPSFAITTAMLWVRGRNEDTNLGDELSDTSRKQQDVSKAPIHKQCDLPKQPQHDIVHINANSGGCEILRTHRDRLAAAAEALGWRHLQPLQSTDGTLSLLLESIHQHLTTLSPVPEDHQESRKLRIFINRFGVVTVDSSAISCLPNSEYIPVRVPETLDLPSQDLDSASITRPSRVYVDAEATPLSIFTTHKTKHRDLYDGARQRVNIEHSLPTTEEVLLYNPHGEIMETSNCTVYFYRQGQWITPAAICGPNIGVTRRLALERNLCKQGTIELKDVKEGEMVWLSNAVRGFFVGVLDLTFNTQNHQMINSKIGHEMVNSDRHTTVGSA